MIAETFDLDDFEGREIFTATLAAEMLTAGLPTLLAASTEGLVAKLWIDSALPLTPPQRQQLNTIVAALDGPADLLLATKASLDLAVDDHARTLNQAAGKTTGDVDTTRDATKTAIDAAATVDDATAIAEAYTGRPL